MSDTLRYELELDKSRALKDVDQFVNEANKRLSKLTLGIKGDGALDRHRRESERFEADAKELRRKAIGDEMDHYRKSVEAKRAAMAQLDRIEVSHGATVLNARRETEARMQSIVQNGHGRTLADIRQALNLELQMYRRAAQERAVIERTAANERAAFARGGRGTMAAFQVQQVVEDFGHAGWRGASNNVAMLASTLGGTGGLVAMLGLTAVALAPVVGKLFELGDAAKYADDRNRDFADSILAVRDAREAARFDVMAEPPRTMDDLAQEREQLDLIRQRVEMTREETAERKRAHEALQSSALFLRDAQHPWWGTNLRADEFKDEARQAFEEAQAILGEDLDIGFDEWAKMSVEGRKDHTDKLRDDVEQRERMARAEIEGAEEKDRLLQDEAEHLREIERFRERIGEFGSAEATLKARHLDDLEREKALLEHELSTLARIADSNEEDLDTRRKAFETGQGIADELERVNDLLEDQKDAERLLEELERNRLDSAKEALRTAQEQNRETERAIELEQKRIEKLKDAAQDAADDWESKSFDFAKDSAKTFTEKQAEWAKRMDRMANPLISALGPNQEVRKFRDAQIDAWFNALGEARQRALNKARMEFLQAEADAAKAQGQETGDEDAFERHREKLREMQDMFLEQGNFAEAQRIADLIQQSFADQQAAAQAAINNLQGEIQSVTELESRIRDLEAASRNIPDLDPVKDWAIQKAGRLADELERAAQAAMRAMGFGGGGGGGFGVAGGFGSGMTLGGFGSLAGGLFGGGFGGLFGGFRASGGPVSDDRAYVVGEAGPEVFVPNVPGSILSADDTRRYLSGSAGLVGASGAVPSVRGGTMNQSIDRSNTSYNLDTVAVTITGPGEIPDIFAMMRSQAANAKIRRGGI